MISIVLGPALHLTLLLLDFNWYNLALCLVFSTSTYTYFALVTGKDPLKVMGTSYLSLNKHGFTYKKRRHKSIEVAWQEVKHMQLHLFSVDFELHGSQTVKVSLEELNDENLKLVKQWLVEVQSTIHT
ncbi:hypothetical protein [Pontibacter korlensis]|uniref:hypothetical protein n=1 Tax=Pontibacter korlensis TaxID=400092 RepID=UPI0011DD2F0D|nr:hypothetical protein [Pontibacter korlensis]